MDERFGFLVADSAGLTVRSETSATPIASFPGIRHQVSADGRSITYWERAQGSTVDRLQVAPIAGGSPARTLLTLDAGERGGPIAWSNDGTGLLITIETGALAAKNDRSELRTVDVASAAQDTVFTTGNGESWYPLAWDRASRVAGVGVVDIGTGYLDDYAVMSFAGQRPSISTSQFRSFEIVHTYLRASADGRYIAGETQTGKRIIWWPVAEPLKRAQIQRESYANGLAWRPGTTQMAWIGGPLATGCSVCGGTEIVLYDVATAAKTAMRVPDATIVRYFRVDGSAAVMDGPTRGTIRVVELATLSTADLQHQGIFMAPVRIR